jgi:predicted metal-binding protein
MLNLLGSCSSYKRMYLVVKMNSFKVKTENNNLKINYYFEFIKKQDIKQDKELFNKMCKKGCKNYNKKYSCPPFVPKLNILLKDNDGLYMVLFLCNLNQINSTEYNKVRIANVVMKSRIIKLMREVEQKFNTIFLSSGSCNLCKPCKLKLNLQCKHPDKRRYSLEAAGIDCHCISKRLFNIPLLWYKNKKAPRYTCVICGLICQKKQKQRIKTEIEKFIKDNFKNN